MWSKTKVLDILKKKEVEEGKEVEMEKGDLPALIIAAFTVFLPIILIFMGAIALILLLLTLYFH